MNQPDMIPKNEFQEILGNQKISRCRKKFMGT